MVYYEEMSMSDIVKTNAGLSERAGLTQQKI